MSVFLSIVIPAYNTINYIEPCVNSIISGSYQDFEILLIDDGSSDGTGELCDRLAGMYSKIQVFHTESRCLSRARNLGIDHARGEYIGFVDSDDIVSPAMFAVLITHMKKEVQLVSCNFLRCTRDQIGLLPQKSTATFCSGTDRIAQKILRGGYGPNVWNKLFRRDLLEQHNIRFQPDCQVGEDQLFIVQYMKYCHKAVFFDSTLYYYITDSGSVMNTFREERAVNSCYVALPQVWNYTAEVMEDISQDLSTYCRSRAAMFYQTVLRKLRNPSQEYIDEAIDYLRKNRFALCKYQWGWKYYLSSIILCLNYRLWAFIFRMSIYNQNRR